MSEALPLLRHNLAQQRQAMLTDDLEAMAALVAEQNTLWSALLAGTADLASLSPDEKRLLGEIKDLVAGNQLLAQQSLQFARRVLGALTGGSNYGLPTQASPNWSGQALDRRA